MIVDIDKIFDLFDSEDNKKESKIEGVTFENFSEHPVYWVGMFKKLIHNHKQFHRRIVGFFKRMDEELDLYDVEEAGEFIVYNRAWFWISKVDLLDSRTQNALKFYSDEYLETYLKFTIHYFQELEEYEKCAHLKNILDEVEKLSN